MTDPADPTISPEQAATYAVFAAIENALESIGSPESMAVVDALAALGVEDERVVATAVFSTVGKLLEAAVHALATDLSGDTSSAASQTGARASTLRPLDADGPPGSGYPDGAYDSGARVLPDHE